MVDTTVRPGPVPYPLPKRLTDRVVPLLLLGLFSPVLAVVLLGMGLDMLLQPRDRGSWFYRERRVSCGREFDLLKFRVLRQEVQDRAAGHARRYERDSENLTWAGQHLLKRWYLDELPQLINVLKGEMSLVGPRPWPVHMVRAQLERGVTYRRSIRAGWTGPAQLQKGDPNPENNEKMDLEYVDRCRRSGRWALFRHDLMTLGRTFRVMAQGQGLSY